MTTTRFPKQPDAVEPTIGPTGSRLLASNPAEDHQLQGQWSAPDEVVGQRLLLTVSEAAQRLGIGRSLLYELLADGQVESIHVGRLRRIPTDALATYIDRQRQSKPGIAV